MDGFEKLLRFEKLRKWSDSAREASLDARRGGGSKESGGGSKEPESEGKKGSSGEKESSGEKKSAGGVDPKVVERAAKDYQSLSDLLDQEMEDSEDFSEDYVSSDVEGAFGDFLERVSGSVDGMSAESRASYEDLKTRFEGSDLRPGDHWGAKKIVDDLKRGGK